MKKYALILAALLLMTSCSVTQRQPGDNMRWIDVYYATSGDKVVDSEQVEIPVDGNITAMIRNSIQLMQRNPIDKKLSIAIPKEVTLTGVKFEHGTAKIEFSEEYLALSGIERTTANYAIVMTLSNFWNVVAVEISVDGEVVVPKIDRESFVTELPVKQR